MLNVFQRAIGDICEYVVDIGLSNSRQWVIPQQPSCIKTHQAVVLCRRDIMPRRLMAVFNYTTDH